MEPRSVHWKQNFSDFAKTSKTVDYARYAGPASFVLGRSPTHTLVRARVAHTDSVAHITTHTEMACRDGNSKTVVVYSNMFTAGARFGSYPRLTIGYLLRPIGNTVTRSSRSLSWSKIKEICLKSAFSLEGKMPMCGPDKPVK